MGCACRGAGKTTFVYTKPSGQKVEYRTEIEARAAVIREGGSYAAKS